jgi:hypothetical protein
MPLGLLWPIVPTSQGGSKVPLARIEMEQVEREGWVARIEAMDAHLNSRALNLRAGSFEELMIMIEDEYRKIVPRNPPAMPKHIEEAIGRASDADYDLPQTVQLAPQPRVPRR